MLGVRFKIKPAVQAKFRYKNGFPAFSSFFLPSARTHTHIVPSSTLFFIYIMARIPGGPILDAIPLLLDSVDTSMDDMTKSSEDDFVVCKFNVCLIPMYVLLLLV